jgi:hypothetical protein
MYGYEVGDMVIHRKHGTKSRIKDIDGPYCLVNVNGDETWVPNGSIQHTRSELDSMDVDSAIKFVIMDGQRKEHDVTG